LDPDAFEPVQMGPSKISEALLIGIKSSVMTGILLVTIGIMNNAIVTSGIGNGFSLMIAQWSGGSLVIAILLIGLASLVLGMGLPVTAAYIILAILTAPALAGILADSIIIDQLVRALPIRPNRQSSCWLTVRMQPRLRPACCVRKRLR
jgi:TRAP-type uncharacterized transport system fused permease subunit